MKDNYSQMQDQATVARLRARARLALTAICVVGIALFTGYLIGQGMTQANYDRLHTGEARE